MVLLRGFKRLVELMPEALGRRLVWVPFSWRLGARYSQAQRMIRWFEAASAAERRSFILRRFRGVLESTLRSNVFYREFYQQHGFEPSKLKDFDDIKRVPIVTKADLQQWLLDSRSSQLSGSFLVNTGGTTGQPLQFRLHRTAFAIEWAHMHYAWRRVGYRQTDLKLTFRGKDLGKDAVRYNAVHNEYVVNAYADLATVARCIERLAVRREIRFVHGYPSTVCEFARYCDEKEPKLTELLRRSLRGVLLGSEYPAPQYRNQIKRVFRVPTISWYGHSEMAVFAYETAEWLYTPMHTYGYCEAVKGSDGNYRLIGTSYDNTASPFIRYDTGDSIEPVDEGRPLVGFRVKAGRIGESILDARGNRISLTALIFGRHHRLFSYARFIQVEQERPGCATVHVTLPTESHYTVAEVSRDFNQDGVDIQFSFKLRDAPARTSAGKTPLLILAAAGAAGGLSTPGSGFVSRR